jgi:YfiH family protein
MESMPTKQLKSPRRTAKRRANAIEVEVIRPTSPAWQQPWLVSGFSTRKGGLSTVFGRKDLNLGVARVDSPSTVEKNRKLFFREVVGARNDSFKLVSLKQIHSGIIHVITRAPKQVLAGDGLLTQTPGLLLSIQTADCVPILLVDPVKRVVGAFHAGWRGTVKRIVEKGVGGMQVHFESKPQDIQAAIGPAIGSCCYAVGEEVIDEFHSQFSYAPSLFSEVFDDDPIKKKYPMLFLTARPPGHSNLGPQIHLDLIAANRRQLLDAGVREANIWSADLCTGCNTERLFSHRKEGGFTGRMMAVIGLRT